MAAEDKFSKDNIVSRLPRVSLGIGKAKETGNPYYYMDVHFSDRFKKRVFFKDVESLYVEQWLNETPTDNTNFMPEVDG